MADTINKRINIYINGEEVKVEAEAIRKKMEAVKLSMVGLDQDSDAFKVAEAKMKSLDKMLTDKVTPSIRNLKAEMTRLMNETGRMKGDEIGGEKYISNMRRIQEIDPILKQHRENVKGVTTEVEKSTEGLSKWQAGIAGFMGGLASKAVDMVANAFQNLGTFLLGTVGEWDEATQAEKKLQTALKGREQIMPSLVEQSKQLQTSMNIDDDDIKAQEAFLAAQGRTEDQIKKTIMAAIQMGAVVGGDLPENIKKLDGSYEGMVKGLGKLDAGIKNLTKEQLANGGAVDMINAKYKGFAETAAQEGVGPIKQLGLVWKDIKENMGGMVASVLLPLASGFMGLATSIRGATDPAKSMSDQFQAQVEKVVDLKKNIYPLCTRYDELKSKASLSKNEHAELGKIIKTVSDAIPGAASAFDKYGNAIALSTSRARQFMNAQVAMMGVLNKKAINETKDDLDKLKDKFKDTQRNMLEIGSTGTYKISTFTAFSSGGGKSSSRNATSDEVVAMKALYVTQFAEKENYYNAIAGLNGNALKKETERQANEAKLFEANEKKKVEYKKKSTEELQKLADAGDAIAESVLEAKSNTGVDKAIKAGKTKEDKIRDYAIQVQKDLEMQRVELMRAGRDKDVSAEKLDLLQKLAEYKGNTAAEVHAKENLIAISAQKISEIEQKYAKEANEKNLQGEWVTYSKLLSHADIHGAEYMSLRLTQIDLERDIELNAKELTERQKYEIEERYIQKRKEAMLSDMSSSLNIISTGIDTEAEWKRQAIQYQINQGKEGYEAKKSALAGEHLSAVDRVAKENALAVDHYNFMAGKIQQYGEYANQAFTSMDNVFRNNEQKQLNTLEKNNNIKKASLKKQLDAKLISEDQYNTSVASLDADLDAKKRKIEHDQALRNKVMQAFQAGINIATAITASLAPPLIWMVPIIAALGALQMAAILTAPIPAMAKGGPIPKEQIIRAGEAGEEWMAPNWMVTDKKTGPIISMLENVRLGKSSGSMPDFGSMEGAASRIGGGSGSGTVVNNTVIQGANNEEFKQLKDEISNMHQTMAELRDYMSDPKNRQATVNRELLSKFDKDEAVLRRLANIK